MSDQNDSRPLPLQGGSLGDRNKRQAEMDAWDAAHPSKDLTLADASNDQMHPCLDLPKQPESPALEPAAAGSVPAPGSPSADPAPDSNTPATPPASESDAQLGGSSSESAPAAPAA